MCESVYNTFTLVIRFRLSQKLNSGKGQFGGRLGKALEKDLTQRPIAAFARISCPDFPKLPDKVEQQLSEDNKTLYRLCVACIDGKKL